MDNTDSPITHSMKSDTIAGAKHVVGSTNIPDAEALMLATMRDKSIKKRRLNFLGILGAIFLMLGLSIFLAPDSFFKLKEDEVTVNKKNENIIPVDKSFAIQIPEEADLVNFRQSSLSGVVGISEILIVRDGRRVEFGDLHPFVPQRFLSALESASVNYYLYGLYKKEGEPSIPFLMLVSSDMKTVEQSLIELERTMYTDLGVILHLVQDVENETRRFETYTSVRNPFKELRDKNANTVMVYGFPMDNVIVFTSSRDAYTGIRARLLTGY